MAFFTQHFRCTCDGPLVYSYISSWLYSAEVYCTQESQGGELCLWLLLYTQGAVSKQSVGVSRETFSSLLVGAEGSITGVPIDVHDGDARGDGKQVWETWEAVHRCTANLPSIAKLHSQTRL